MTTGEWRVLNSADNFVKHARALGLKTGIPELDESFETLAKNVDFYNLPTDVQRRALHAENKERRKRYQETGE